MIPGKTDFPGLHAGRDPRDIKPLPPKILTDSIARGLRSNNFL
jgi:hypothetical protein